MFHKYRLRVLIEGRKTVRFFDFQTSGKFSELYTMKSIEEWLELTNMGIFFNTFYSDIKNNYFTDLIFPDQETKALFKFAFNVP